MKEPMKTVKTVIEGKRITLFRNEDTAAPVVYANMVADAGAEVMTHCEQLGCEPFHLVTVTNLRWDEELSPWACEPVISKDNHFTGESSRYACFIEEKIIPWAEREIKPRCRVIAGYSMAGLFALYAPYVSGAFSKSVAASGSVWYPGFVSYVRTHDFMKTPEAVYLSLGDLESRGKNPYLSQTENAMRSLRAFYQSRAIHTVFELNPGNHFKDAAFRLAKGIARILR